MEPFYFGKPPKSLFGIYHPPQAKTARKAGVVLCYPIGQEYIRSHRAFLQLAIMLSSAGFHTLRFDYYGSGDSEGDCEQGEVRQWISDVSTAVEELKGGCDVGRICLAGLRLGGSLSLEAGAERGDIDGIVLWEPVVDGKQYIEELTASHREWLVGSFAKPLSGPDGHKDIEIIGFPLTEITLKGIEDINLLEIQQKPADDILLIDNSEVAGNGSIKKHLESRGVRARYNHIPSPEVWVKKDDEMSKGLVPIQVLQSVVSWISEVFP